MWKKENTKHGTNEFKAKISASVAKLHLNKEYSQKVTRNWIKASSLKKVSKLELSVKDILLKYRFLHSEDRDQPFIGPYIPDYVNYSDKIIIEIYGDYWHANPAIYSAKDYVFTDNRTNIKWFAETCWKRDQIRQKFYESKGWRFVVIWESKIKAHLVEEELRRYNI